MLGWFCDIDFDFQKILGEVLIADLKVDFQKILGKVFKVDLKVDFRGSLVTSWGEVAQL